MEFTYEEEQRLAKERARTIAGLGIESGLQQLLDGPELAAEREKRETEERVRQEEEAERERLKAAAEKEQKEREEAAERERQERERFAGQLRRMQMEQNRGRSY